MQGRRKHTVNISLFLYEFGNVHSNLLSFLLCLDLSQTNTSVGQIQHASCNCTISSRQSLLTKCSLMISDCLLVKKWLIIKINIWQITRYLYELSISYLLKTLDQFTYKVFHIQSSFDYIFHRHETKLVYRLFIIPFGIIIVHFLIVGMMADWQWETWLANDRGTIA